MRAPSKSPFEPRAEDTPPDPPSPKPAISYGGSPLRHVGRRNHFFGLLFFVATSQAQNSPTPTTCWRPASSIGYYLQLLPHPLCSGSISRIKIVTHFTALRAYSVPVDKFDFRLFRTRQAGESAVAARVLAKLKRRNAFLEILVSGHFLSSLNGVC